LTDPFYFSVRPGQGSARESWDAMGSPHQVTASQLELLRAHSVPAWTCRKITANQPVTISLEPYSFAFIEISPSASPAFGKGARDEGLDALNQSLTLS
jgi:beta-xylosidase